MTEIQFASLPAMGQPLAGGTFFGITTLPDGTHSAVVLMDDKLSKPVTWQAAMDWAALLDAQLPTRPVAALLYANVKARFEEAWYWTNETHEASDSSAWLCHFYKGSQTYAHKSYQFCTLAVRYVKVLP